MKFFIFILLPIFCYCQKINRYELYFQALENLKINVDENTYINVSPDYLFPSIATGPGLSYISNVDYKIDSINKPLYYHNIRVHNNLFYDYTRAMRIKDHSSYKIIKVSSPTDLWLNYFLYVFDDYELMDSQILTIPIVISEYENDVVIDTKQLYVEFIFDKGRDNYFFKKILK